MSNQPGAGHLGNSCDLRGLGRQQPGYPEAACPAGSMRERFSASSRHNASQQEQHCITGRPQQVVHLTEQPVSHWDRVDICRSFAHTYCGASGGFPARKTGCSIAEFQTSRFPEIGVTQRSRHLCVPPAHLLCFLSITHGFRSLVKPHFVLRA